MGYCCMYFNLRRSWFFNSILMHIFSTTVYLNLRHKVEIPAHGVFLHKIQTTCIDQISIDNYPVTDNVLYAMIKYSPRCNDRRFTDCGLNYDQSLVDNWSLLRLLFDSFG